MFELYIGIAVAVVLSCGIVAYLTPKLLVFSLRKRFVDGFSHRKTHTETASRLGGVSFFPAIFLSVCLSLLIVYINNGKWFNAGFVMRIISGSSALLILYFVGIVDDIKDVRYRKKLVFQILASALIVFSGTWIKTFHGFLGIGDLPDYIGMALTLLLLVFIINSVNFIDGIDGLASLLSIIALLVYGIMFILQNAVLYSLIAFAAMGALLSFFYFNVFRVKKTSDSKIFMGDVGTLVIGFILGVMAVELWNMSIPGESAYYYVLSYTMLAIPCFDTVRVVLYRIKNRRPIFVADNNHIHHLFMDMGLTQHQTLALIVFGDMLLLLMNICLAEALNISAIMIITLLFMILYVKIIRKIQTKK